MIPGGELSRGVSRIDPDPAFSMVTELPEAVLLLFQLPSVFAAAGSLALRSKGAPAVEVPRAPPTLSLASAAMTALLDPVASTVAKSGLAPVSPEVVKMIDAEEVAVPSVTS